MWFQPFPEAPFWTRYSYYHDKPGFVLQTTTLWGSENQMIFWFCWVDKTSVAFTSFGSNSSRVRVNRSVILAIDNFSFCWNLELSLQSRDGRSVFCDGSNNCRPQKLVETTSMPEKRKEVTWKSDKDRAFAFSQQVLLETPFCFCNHPTSPSFATHLIPLSFFAWSIRRYGAIAAETYLTVRKNQPWTHPGGLIRG